MDERTGVKGEAEPVVDPVATVLDRLRVAAEGRSAEAEATWKRVTVRLGTGDLAAIEALVKRGGTGLRKAQVALGLVVGAANEIGA